MTTARRDCSRRWGIVSLVRYALKAEDELVPFGEDQAHKAFALAVGLHMLVGALAGDEYGAVLLVARPDHDPVPALRARAEGIRLPGDA